MKKKLFSVLFALVMVLSLSLVTAAPATAQENKPITPPELKQITFIHYAQPDFPGKPDRPPGQDKKDKDPPPVDNGYYELLGLYLPGNFDIQVNPAGGPEGALYEIEQAFETWDDVVNTELFKDEIGTTTVSGVADDSQNTVSWVRIVPRKIIAMVSIWYLDDNDPETLDKIFEFDIVLNSFLEWGIDPDDEGAFNVQNIMTHEVGHPVGLADLYEEEYRELTMYGYSSKGETQKISLEEGDKVGALAIYKATP